MHLRAGGHAWVQCILGTQGGVCWTLFIIACHFEFQAVNREGCDDEMPTLARVGCGWAAEKRCGCACIKCEAQLAARQACTSWPSDCKRCLGAGRPQASASALAGSGTFKKHTLARSVLLPVHVWK